MNASDIVKAKQNRTLYQAYYRPDILGSGQFTFSTVNLCPVSSSAGTISYTSSVTRYYTYKCDEPAISYELANSINSGKYLCGYPSCSTISIWNTGQTIPTGVCDCKISNLAWKNTTNTLLYSYSTATYSSISTFSTSVLTGPGPVICPAVSFYQGTNFDSKCNTCNNTLYGNNVCGNC
jgi:hypothetical protein